MAEGWLDPGKLKKVKRKYDKGKLYFSTKKSSNTVAENHNFQEIVQFQCTFFL